MEINLYNFIVDLREMNFMGILFYDVDIIIWLFVSYFFYFYLIIFINVIFDCYLVDLRGMNFKGILINVMDFFGDRNFYYYLGNFREKDLNGMMFFYMIYEKGKKDWNGI